MLGWEWQFAQQDGAGRPDLAVVAELLVPADRGLLLGETKPYGKLVAGWDPLDTLNLTANVMFGLPIEDGVRYGQWIGSLALGVGLTDRLGLFGEWYGYFPGGLGTGNQSYLEAGLEAWVTERVTLDIRAGGGLNGGGGVQAGAGFTYAF